MNRTLSGLLVSQSCDDDALKTCTDADAVAASGCGGLRPRLLVLSEPVLWGRRPVPEVSSFRTMLATLCELITSGAAAASH